MVPTFLPYFQSAGGVLFLHDLNIAAKITVAAWILLPWLRKVSTSPAYRKATFLAALIVPAMLIPIVVAGILFIASPWLGVPAIVMVICMAIRLLRKIQLQRFGGNDYTNTHHPFSYQFIAALLITDFTDPLQSLLFVLVWIFCLWRLKAGMATPG